MAWVATAELAAAVSEAGGLGVVGGGNNPPDYLSEQIRNVKKSTGRPFGVNIPLFSAWIEELVQICIDEQVPVVSTGSGNPGPYVTQLKQAGIVVIPVVASVGLRGGSPGWVWMPLWLKARSPAGTSETLRRCLSYPR